MGGAFSSGSRHNKLEEEKELLTDQDFRINTQQGGNEIPAEAPASEYDLLNGINVNTYWKNIPPPECKIYWLYSNTISNGCSGSDYYFMSQEDSDNLERSYIQGKQTCDLSAVNASVDFRIAKQRSKCGGGERNIRRLTKQQYTDIQNQYKDFFCGRSVYWCLRCRNHYLLYSPKYQEELDRAYQDGNILNVKINDRYSYTIDPRNYYQKNNFTEKKRELARVYANCNDMVIYGSHFLKYDRAETPSIMERSNIYQAGGSQVSYC